jgi:hypothetical protein
MIQSFFQSLEARGVRYLLISGQASVLYGAATFSEDIDLWVAPTKANLQRLLTSLADVGAAVYKLTPPLTARHAGRGHGFHFLLPDEFTPAYLDVMGKPPRVSSFAAAKRNSIRISCDWGNLPVVSIPDLVELKKTRRLADYEIISNLVKVRLSAASAHSTELEWGLKNVFRIEDADWILRRWNRARGIARTLERPWLRQLTDSGPTLAYEEIQSSLAREIAMLQHKDILYWQPIIADLRALRKTRLLWKQGTPVRLR